MDIKTAIEKAGGQAQVARACTAKSGKPLSRFAVHAWVKRGFPSTEWTGKTGHAKVICDLAAIFGHNIKPIDICPGAGQYMEQPEEEAA